MSWMKRSPVRLVFFGLLVVALAACSLLGGGEDAEPTAMADATETPAEAAPTDTPEATPLPAGGTLTAEANVESIEILVLESFPVQINVIASGTLPDACTELNPALTVQEGDTFNVTLTTSRPADEVCAEVIESFDTVIPLDVEGLPAGTYTVNVNGITDTFTLEVDNVPQTEPTEEATDGAGDGDGDGGGAIGGIVWHDLCAVPEGEGGTPSDGCVANADGSYSANGVLEGDEPRLEGVVVALSEGACPATAAMETSTTGADGDYNFDGLAPGTYCVTVDALEETNSSILIPGSWTFPTPDDGTGLANAEVTVSAAESVADINFGWDYQFLPEPEQTVEEKDCTDAADFVADVTIQDNEVIPAGTVFTKTWRLINTGTCTWTTDYDLIFAEGDQMGGPDAQPIPLQVPPDTVIDLSVQLTAPDVNGTYRGDWQLQNELGQPFGIPTDVTFWVQIVVEDGTEPADAESFLWLDKLALLPEWLQ